MKCWTWSKTLNLFSEIKIERWTFPLLEWRRCIRCLFCLPSILPPHLTFLLEPEERKLNSGLHYLSLTYFFYVLSSWHLLFSLCFFSSINLELLILQPAPLFCLIHLLSLTICFLLANSQCSSLKPAAPFSNVRQGQKNLTLSKTLHNIALPEHEK